jgi:hypothetical protein
MAIKEQVLDRVRSSGTQNLAIVRLSCGRPCGTGSIGFPEFMGSEDERAPCGPVEDRSASSRRCWLAGRRSLRRPAGRRCRSSRRELEASVPRGQEARPRRGRCVEGLQPEVQLAAEVADLTTSLGEAHVELRVWEEIRRRQPMSSTPRSRSTNCGLKIDAAANQ